MLACVVDKIVVDGRGHIRPYYFVPGVLILFPSRRRRDTLGPRGLIAAALENATHRTLFPDWRTLS